MARQRKMALYRQTFLPSASSRFITNNLGPLRHLIDCPSRNSGRTVSSLCFGKSIAAVCEYSHHGMATCRIGWFILLVVLLVKLRASQNLEYRRSNDATHVMPIPRERASDQRAHIPARRVRCCGVSVRAAGADAEGCHACSER